MRALLCVGAGSSEQPAAFGSFHAGSAVGASWSRWKLASQKQIREGGDELFDGAHQILSLIHI